MRTPCFLLLGLSLALAGCSTLRRSGLDLNSTRSQDRLSTDPTVRVYSASDRNTADFYLTDLPPTALPQTGKEADLTPLAGSLVHLHLFLQPRAGQTPIADEACSFTIRQVVFAHGQIGVYSGGGFLTLSRDLGAKSSGGTFRGATLRLTQSTPGFTDRLGPSEMNGTFSADRDDRAAATWAALLARAMEACAKPADGPAANTPTAPK